MDIECVMSFINEIRKKKMSDVVSNYYRNIPKDTDISCFLKGHDSIVFGIEEGEFQRIFFFGLREEIAHLLRKVQKSSVMDCLSRQQTDYEWLSGTGFVIRDELLRYINMDMSKIFREEKNLRKKVVSSNDIFLATKKDVDSILKLICQNFDLLSSHFISRNQVMLLVEQGLVWIAKEKNRITSLALCILEGKKFYLNYLVNSSKQIRGRDIFARAMCDAIDKGYRYGYMWVSQENIRAIHVYKSLLYEPDGIKNTILVKDE